MTKARSSGSRALLMLAAFAIAATVGLCANGVADEASDAGAGLELAKSRASARRATSFPSRSDRPSPRSPKARAPRPRPYATFSSKRRAP